MQNYNFITLGNDCSLATALRNLKLRKFALPFDWTVATVDKIEQCFSDNFAKYHANLRLNKNATRLIDYYGFEFPHDYPVITTEIINTHDIAEGNFPEDKKQIIVPNWEKYYSIAKDKYNRRIQRFLDIMNDPHPIIALCRYSLKDAERLPDLFCKYYNKTNIIFINAIVGANNQQINKKIIHCNIERNGIWNDIAVLEEYINIAIKIILQEKSNSIENIVN